MTWASFLKYISDASASGIASIADTRYVWFGSEEAKKYTDVLCFCMSVTIDEDESMATC